MSVLNKSRILFLCVAGLLVLYGPASFSESRGGVQGYWTDSEGNVLRNSDGGCARSGVWTDDMATVVGCDGVVVDKTAELILGGRSGLLAEINFPAATMFAFDKAVLTDEGKATLAAYREKIRPELARAYAAIIVGHTDSIGDPEYNLDLSKRRAQAVFDFLEEQGVKADKLRVAGLGDKAPIASNETASGRAKNRRVQIIVVAEMRDWDLLRLPSTALFQRRSATLTEQGEKSLIQDIQTSLDLLRRATYIEVIGHTDDVGDAMNNLKLSLLRAEVVSQYLVDLGVNAYKIKAVGAGKAFPIATNNTPEGRAENRRVEIRILGRVR